METEHPFLRELAGALRRHLVTPPQKVPHFVIDHARQPPGRPCLWNHSRSMLASLSVSDSAARSPFPNGSMLPGTSRSPTFVLILDTLFFDGLCRYTPAPFADCSAARMCIPENRIAPHGRCGTLVFFSLRVNSSRSSTRAFHPAPLSLSRD